MQATTTTTPNRLRLQDRYEAVEGRVFLTGMQAIVRGILDQARDDHAAGLDISSFVSGYPGSPLGGFENTVRAAGALLDERKVVLEPGINEELAATAVLGATKRGIYPDPGSLDGVTGVWYGKCNGVDRCVDVFKYGNYGGMSANDAVIVLAGDDPNVKSSGIPGESEHTLAAAGIPVLYPASVAEMYTMTRHAIAASRLTGCWVALKLTTDLCDGGATVEVSRAFSPSLPDLPPDFEKFDTTFYFGQPILDGEDSLYGVRHEAFRRYVRANGLDRFAGGGGTRGLITAGKTASDTRQALRDIGLDDRRLDDHGVRLLQLGSVYPIDPDTVRRFATGLDEILVIEEKRDFVEQQVARILYGAEAAPVLVGKKDRSGGPLVPVRGELDAERVADVLVRWHPPLGGRDAPSQVPESRSALPELPMALQRTPNYCSGCPHSRSTVTPEGETVLGGIGCHSIGLFLPEGDRHYTMNVQMGGEGAPFLGARSFVGTEHVVQNLGDGTYYHSASQAVRWCVTAGVDITFRLLYNGHISMTGGQQIPGINGVAALSRELEAMGVRRTVIATEDSSQYEGLPLGSQTRVVGRDRMVQELDDLSDEPGVTFLIHDGECALEKQRRWRRGTSAPPEERLYIHPEICEGCGDCGARSNCPSVQPVDTELGRKTQIEQSSCSVDWACLQGDCPSFVGVTVPGGKLPDRQPPFLAADDLADPPPTSLDAPYRVLLVGIGGTGVLTTNALLAHAALMEDRAAVTLDQTGLAQKGGPVSSHCIIAPDESGLLSNKVGVGQADLYLGLDLLESVKDQHLHRTGRATRAVVNTSVTATGGMVRDVWAPSPDVPTLAQAVLSATDETAGSLVPAGAMADRLFADHMKTNIVALGAACQAGLLPLAPQTIEAAIELNGIDVDANVLAFRYGRLAITDPERVERMLEPQQPAVDEVDTSVLPNVLSVLPEDLSDFIARRYRDLERYQDQRYAERYLDAVREVAEREAELSAGRTEITETYALQLYKLMAYKDEYEVARLLLDPSWRSELTATFGDDATDVVYYLHPPALRALGLKSKLRLGRWSHPVLRLLRAMRRVRGTWLDLFGHTRLRRQERKLPGWYTSAVHQAMEQAGGEYERALAVARAADRIRGFEELKLDNIEQAKATVDRLLDRRDQ